MRILFFMRDLLPPTRPDVAVLFGKELRALGVSSDLAGQASAKAAAQPAWPAGATYLCGRERSGMVGDFLRAWYDLRLLFKLSRDHDVLQVRDKIRTGVLAWLASRFTRHPFAYWMSFPFVEGFEVRAAQVGRSQGTVVWLANALRARLARAAFYGWVAPRADHLFVQSDAMLEFMAAKGIPRERMTAVPMGVDDALLDAALAPLQHEPRFAGRRVITYLGSLAQSRHSDFLLEVVAQVREQVPDVLLLLAGDAVSADEQRWIRARIDELGVQDCVWLTGWLPQSEAIALVRQAQVGLSPIPRGELFDVSSPTKAVEYLALGIPCVGNDIPDQAQVLRDSGAGLCVEMQVQPFAQAVVSLLRDEAGAKAMGAKGPEWVRLHRSYRVIAARVAAAYEQVLAKRAPKTRGQEFK